MFCVPNFNLMQETRGDPHLK